MGYRMRAVTVSWPMHTGVFGGVSAKLRRGGGCDPGGGEGVRPVRSMTCLEDDATG